jgi:hypothetical protein
VALSFGLPFLNIIWVSRILHPDLGDLQDARRLCDSLARYGFKDIILMSSHGGNNAVLKAVTPDLAKNLYGRVNIHLVLRTEKGCTDGRLLKGKGNIS